MFELFFSIVFIVCHSLCHRTQYTRRLLWSILNLYHYQGNLAFPYKHTYTCLHIHLTVHGNGFWQFEMSCARFRTRRFRICSLKKKIGFFFVWIAKKIDRSQEQIFIKYEIRRTKMGSQCGLKFFRILFFFWCEFSKIHTQKRSMQLHHPTNGVCVTSTFFCIRITFAVLHQCKTQRINEMRLRKRPPYVGNGMQIHAIDCMHEWNGNRPGTSVLLAIFRIRSVLLLYQRQRRYACVSVSVCATF